MGRLQKIWPAERTEKLTGWWYARSPQEQRTLKIALPIICLMILYLLVIEPILSVYSERKERYLEARETLTWLYDQAPLVSRMQNACGQRVFYLQGDDDPQALLQDIARRTSVAVRADTTGANGLAITVNSAAGNRLLSYVQTLSCNGFNIEDLQVSRIAETTAVKATLTAVPVSLPRQYR